MTDRFRRTVEQTLSELEARGGYAFAQSSTQVGLAMRLSRSRPNESVISGVVRWMGPALADGTPLRSVSPNVPFGADPLTETGVRDTLIWRGWKVDGAQLTKDWRIGSDAD